MADLYNKGVRVTQTINANQWSHPPCLVRYVPRQGNWELIVVPNTQLLYTMVYNVFSDQELNPEPLGLEANLFTTTPFYLTFQKVQMIQPFCTQDDGHHHLVSRRNAIIHGLIYCFWKKQNTLYAWRRSSLCETYKLHNNESRSF